MSSLDFQNVEESFIGKLGTTQDYAWLYEGLENIENLTDDDIREYVDEQASHLYEMYDAENTEADRESLPFADWKAASDYEAALQAVMDAQTRERSEIAGANTFGIEVYENTVSSWPEVHQALAPFPHYWNDNTLIVPMYPGSIDPVVQALNALGVETDEDQNIGNEF